MQVHTIRFDDFSCDVFHLIGIHSTLEDYRLAYLLNQKLNINLHRSETDIDVQKQAQKAYFSLFEFHDDYAENSWFLISNQFKTKIHEINVGLFSENETRIPLITEQKKVDYFLKLEGEFSLQKANKINEAIKFIPQIITSYTIKTNRLKSKEYLIF